MIMISNLALLILGFILLVKGSEYFVDGASAIATRLKVSQLVIGLTIVAMGTSAPEAAVSIRAALEHTPDIAVGNILGSNILNILLILGISSVIAPLAIARSTTLFEIPFMLFITALLMYMGYDGALAGPDGLILLLLFVFYLMYMAVPNKSDGTSIAELKYVPKNRQVIYLIGGLAAIIIGSRFAVYGAKEIANMLHMSERVISVTIVALGTSLPELFTSVTAARKGNADIAVGNIVGSNIFNILFILGISGVITPVPYEKRFILDGVIALIAAGILFFAALPKRRLTLPHGLIMLCAYCAYLIILFNF